MSPHVANFVHDLVAMAKAMEENPILQDQIEVLKTQLSAAQDHNAGLEVNIISYKQQIDDLQAKVRQAEVARDDAEYRFLELDEKSHTVLGDIESILTLANAAKLILNPPKPEPVVEPVSVLPQAVPSEPVQVEMPEGHQVTAIPQSPDATQGQSEASPTAEPSSPVSSTPQSDSVVSIVEPKPEPSSADADPEPEPRWSYEWYQWNDRRNERAARAASGH